MKTYVLVSEKNWHQELYQALSNRPKEHWVFISTLADFCLKRIVELSEEGLDAKSKAMESYEFEKRNYPHPRSSQALKIRAQMWGVANGIKLAEAFQVIRTIDNI